MTAFVDAHAHFHAGFSLRTYLTCAAKNVRSYFEIAKPSAPPVGVLLLADMHSQPPLGKVQQDLAELGKAWSITQPDRDSIVFRNGHATLVLIAGRQVVTSENLEVLSLCSQGLVPSGKSLRETIGRVAAVNGTAVVPWGFGKWWFRRGQVVNSLLTAKAVEPFWMGDSGCRPAAMPSALLATAKRKGIACLPGSDPLPLRSHEKRAGSFGSFVTASIDFNCPTKSVRESLLTASRPQPFGRRTSFGAFVFDQIGVRLAKGANR